MPRLPGRLVAIDKWHTALRDFLSASRPKHGLVLTLGGGRGLVQCTSGAAAAKVPLPNQVVCGPRFGTFLAGVQGACILLILQQSVI